MRSSKKEANNLKSSIIHSYQRIIIEDDDGIWENIVDNVLEVNQNHQSIFDDTKRKPYSYPFINYERPDIYYIGKDYIMGLEHFQFDSSRKNKKGSALEQKKSLVYQNLDKIAIKRSEKDIRLCEIVDTTLSLEYYDQSLLKAFNSHYERVYDYKRRLKQID